MLYIIGILNKKATQSMSGTYGILNLIRKYNDFLLKQNIKITNY